MPSEFSQLPLAGDSQDSMSFITNEGVWTPSRVPQGAMDSPLHFQNQMNVVFEDMQPTQVLIWIDDILLFARSPQEFIETLRRFLARVRERGLKLSAVKSFLFRNEAKCCGRLFSGVGVRHDPERLSGLHQLPLPSTAADLQQLLCATGWMRDSLMDYSRVMQPLHDKLEGGCTKRLAAGAAITWTAADTTAFETARPLLTTSQTLHYPSQNASIVLMSDASDRGWGLVVTQVKDWVDGLPVTDQRHELLVCKSGKFDDTASRWSIIEKEAFPIIWAARNLTYLLNLIYVFAPDQEVKRHVRGKLQRWAMSLMGFQYQIEHVDGSINLWADLLSRWGLASREEGGVTKYKAITPSRTHETISADTQMRRLHLRAGSFVFPSLSEIQTAQQQHARPAPPTARRDDNGVLVVGDRLWVPEMEVALLQRILIVAHCETQGHRGIEPMMTTMTAIFEIANLTQVCRRFLSKCLLCKHVKGGNIIPRPWGPTYDAKKRNELLHFDFLYLGDSMGATETIWCPSILISDQGSHFKNELITMVCKKLAIDQSLVVAYAPWINGTVERLNRDVLQVLRVLLMEYSLDTHEWAPSELFTGLPRPTPFEPILLERGQRFDILETAVLPIEQLDQLRVSLAGLHKEVLDQREKRRLQNMARSKGIECNFSVGDFILWSRIDSRMSTDKLLARWDGPFEVTETAPHSFTIRHLVTNKHYEVHGSRLKFYADSSFEVNKELLAHVGNQGVVLGVESITKHRKANGVWQLLVSWEGLQEEEIRGNL
ncbi:LOW QUALITY PROTEIN: hypothetical protein PHPALM_27929 [Phytophthora palmivora]|uniref:Integrase catalytic domain-containing protein n=1 Tax=Phytophthora palmivora TaxID=4796 RepID=A0A2P4XBD9_9STRA|nr:LOW QUALITY PROTEIN: hypothetical protein PHPALM_27929 [Phytophthora palmivora]